MNFLAHLYLSKTHQGVLIGNFIADGIKGKQHLDLPEGIQTGVVHHRAIDAYTDQHPIFLQSKRRLHQRYGHYKGVIIDILYDHFLARNWNRYSQTPLDIYANGVYQLLQANFETLPPRMQDLLPYMIEQNWLVSYSTRNGIKEVLYRMNLRTQNRSRMDMAIADLNADYGNFERDFTEFFEHLMIFSEEKLSALLNQPARLST